MVRSLRKKFVLATMTLMLVVFGVVFVCAAVYNNYWHTQETINILEWLADSGVFLEEESAPRAFAGENRVVQPILGVVVDAFGEIESVTTLGALDIQ